MAEPGARTLQVVGVVVGQSDGAAVRQRAGEPEGRVPEPTADLEDPARAHEQRELVQQTTHHGTHDGEAVSLVGVAPHLRLHRIRGAGEPREIFVDEGVDDVQVALHAGPKVAQMAAP